MEKSKVYFSSDISSQGILELYKKLGYELEGSIAVKVHSGEVGNQNFLGPDMFKDIMDYVKGTIVECNTAYDGERNTSEKLLLKHCAKAMINRQMQLLHQIGFIFGSNYRNISNPLNFTARFPSQKDGFNAHCLCR